MNISSLTTNAALATGLAGGIAGAAANLVIVSPKNTIGYQPQPPIGQTGVVKKPALLFHYEGENNVVLQSDITDNFVEDNTAINDQISLKPETITVHGYIGDLNDVPPNTALNIAKTVADKLILLSAFTPALSVTALNAYNEATLAYKTAEIAAQAIVSSLNALNGGQGRAVIDGNGIDNVTTPGIFSSFTSTQTPQQIMFQQFYGYWRSRVLFTVQTPWAVFTNMAIQTLRAVQDADTNSISDFEVTFKIIRYASTTDFKIAQGRRSDQSSPVISSNANVGQTSIPFPGIV